MSSRNVFITIIKKIHTINGADFNTILDTEIDRKNGLKYTHTNIRTRLQQIINANNLIDIWRAQHPKKHKFTWHSNTRPIIFSRLDYFLISDSLLNVINKSEIKPGYYSDHSIINLNIDFVKIEKEPGFFKINNSVILEKDYQDKIKKASKRQ